MASLLVQKRMLKTVNVLVLLLTRIQASFSLVVGRRRPHYFSTPSRHAERATTCCHASSTTRESIDNDPTSASTLRSMTFCHLDKTQQPQLLCDFLMELGACSTSIVDADKDTALEQAIYREPEAETWNQDSNAAVICGDAAVGRNVWNRCNVTAHFAASADLQLVAEMVSETLDLELQDYSVEQVPNRDWVIHVQQSWKPILISGLVLRFPWHSQQDVEEVVGADQSVIELQLEGGTAFGTGEHPTTQLCLQWIQEILKQDDGIADILDYGSGSGVLGLAACALSKNNIEAVGVDIDLDAVRIANANAETNGLNMKSYLPPLEETEDKESKSLLMKAHHVSGDEILDNDGRLYDACVANILAGPLVTLAPTLASMVKPKGYLGLSGILAPQAQMVIDSYSEHFDDVQVEHEMEGWILLTGTRK